MNSAVSVLVGPDLHPVNDGHVGVADILESVASGSLPDGMIRHIRSGCDDVTESYGELLTASRHIGRELQTSGLEYGDRVLIDGSDSQHFLHCLWGTWLAGLIAVPFGTGSADRQSGGLRALVSRVSCKHALVPAAYLARVSESLLGLDISVTAPTENVGSLPDLERHQVEPDDVVLIQPTSGTSSQSKLVALTNKNLIGVLRATAKTSILSRSRSVSWMPLDHIGSIVWHLRNVFGGCREETLAHHSAFLSDPLNWIDWLSAYEAETTRAANFGFAMVVRELRKGRCRQWSLSALQVCISTAERVDPTVVAGFLELLAPFGLRSDTVFPSYGMAEMGAGVVFADGACVPPQGVFYMSSGAAPTTSAAETVGGVKPVGYAVVGRPVAGVSLRVVDRDGRVLSQGEVGHIELTGETMSPGYWGAESATSKTVAEDGWFRTGDMGLVCMDRLVVTGRTADWLVVKGRNVVAGEVEACVRDVAGVEPLTVAVCQVTSNVDEEVLVFFSPQGAPQEIPAVIRRIRALIPRRFGFAPDRVLPVKETEVPRTSVGKVVKRRLVEAFFAGDFDEWLDAELEPVGDELAASDGVDNSAGEPRRQEPHGTGRAVQPDRALPPQVGDVVAIWASVFGGVALTPESDFFELGGHSLQAIAIAARLEEKLGLVIEPEQLWESSSPRLLWEALQARDAQTSS